MKLKSNRGSSEIFTPKLSNNNQEVIQLLKGYNEMIGLIARGKKWVDNGLRVCSKVIGVPRDYKERGMALENELGRDLASIKGLNYSLQVTIGLQIADAVVRLDNGLMLRIEAKYVSPSMDRRWKYKSFFEWATKYREKSDFFFPYTLLYMNYDLYRELSKDDFKMFYPNNIVITNFRTIRRILDKIASLSGEKEK